MKTQLLTCIFFVSITGGVLAATPEVPAKPRGQMLYENHCIRCHAGSVHAREPRRVTNLNDLYHWVGKWSTIQKLDWSKDEIRDVVDYLNHAYYQLEK